MSLPGAVHGGELHDAPHAHRGMVPHATAGALLLARGAHDELRARLPTGGVYIHLIATPQQRDSHGRPLNRTHDAKDRRRLGGCG